VGRAVGPDLDQRPVPAGFAHVLVSGEPVLAARQESGAAAGPAGVDVDVPIVDGSTVIGVVTRRYLVRMIARADTTVAAEVQRVLDVYGGGRKWTVTVNRSSLLVPQG
jgi:hypothetical protein